MLARGARRDESRHGNTKGLVSLDTSPFCVLLATRSRPTAWQSNTGQAVSVLAVFADTILVSRTNFPGRVGEWLKPADCKSAAPCGLRRFESFPVHQDSSFVNQSPGEKFPGDAGSRNQQVHRRKSQHAMFKSGTKRGEQAG